MISRETSEARKTSLLGKKMRGRKGDRTEFRARNSGLASWQRWKEMCQRLTGDGVHALLRAAASHTSSIPKDQVDAA